MIGNVIVGAIGGIVDGVGKVIFNISHSVIYAAIVRMFGEGRFVRGIAVVVSFMISILALVGIGWLIFRIVAH